MNSSKNAGGPWLDDIENSRDLDRNEKQQIGFLVAWLESWRIPKSLPAGRDACRRFWKEVVLAKPRESWQLDQWTQAVRWYLNWLELCAREGKPNAGIPERMSNAVHHFGARRGLALVIPCQQSSCRIGILYEIYKSQHS